MRIHLLTFFLFITSLSFSQKKDILKNFNKDGMETSILVQESPLFNLNLSNQTIQMYDYFQVFKSISQSDLLNRLIALPVLKNDTKKSHFSKIIPLSFLHTKYETIKSNAFKNGSVTNNEEGFLIRTNNTDVFNLHALTAASALRINHKGLSTNFTLNSNRIFNTTQDKITQIKIDFDNGEGFKEIKINTIINIQYQNAGIKELVFEINFENSPTIITKSNFTILYSNEDLNNLFNRSPTYFTSSIIPDLSIYNENSYAGQGEYEIFLSTEPNAVLDKPIFIVDGFDPFDRRPISGYTDTSSGNFIEGIYDLFDYGTGPSTNNLADLVRAEGFDVIILNFPIYTRVIDNEVVDGGVDFIERNAMLLVELINQINSQKIGTEKNVVIGPSMGGLISQYALNFMENQSMNHDTRLWLAFDAPLLGANVPIGFQHQFNFLANGLNDFWFIGNQNVEALQPIVNGMMKSNAARQMLVDQLEAHITNSDGVSFNSNLKLPQKHPFNPIFFNRMHALTSSGFPENVRKVSISNGSGIGEFYQDKNGVDILPGREIVDASIDVTTGTEAFLNVNFTGYSNNIVEVSNVYIDFAWYIPAFDVESDADSQSFPFSNGVDAASGGLFDLSNVTNSVGTSGIAGEFVTGLQTDYFNFIPSVSSMAYSFSNNEIDWDYVDDGPTSTTIFDAWYMPNFNEPHVTITPDNVEFSWDEIVLRPASINGNSLDNNLQIINPVSNELIILNNSNANNITCTIFNIEGKKMITKTLINPVNKIIIPITFTNGIYFIQIQTNNKSTTKKIIIR